MSVLLHNHDLLLRVGLCLIVALAVALVVSCSSEPAPEPAPVPTATSVALVARQQLPLPPPLAGPVSVVWLQTSACLQREATTCRYRVCSMTTRLLCWCSTAGTSEGYVAASSASWQRRTPSSRSATRPWWRLARTTFSTR